MGWRNCKYGRVRPFSSALIQHRHQWVSQAGGEGVETSVCLSLRLSVRPSVQPSIWDVAYIAINTVCVRHTQSNVLHVTMLEVPENPDDDAN